MKLATTKEGVIVFKEVFDPIVLQHSDCQEMTVCMRDGGFEFGIFKEGGGKESSYHYVKDGQVSDGYHTFEELYTHRLYLYVALMMSHKDISWKSEKHSDGTVYPGWFVAGMRLPNGDITYHIPMTMWDSLTGIEELIIAPEWDGHTSNDVLDRINEWVATTK
jgi:hypothetical protein